MTTVAAFSSTACADGAHHVDDMAPGRDGRWLADPGFGVYVHIPFCRRRCHYCDFNTYEGQDELHAAYVDAVIRTIDRHPPGPVATSVFFGGGTPTLLPARDLGRTLAAVRDHFGVAADAEVTVEANPETVDEAKFEALLESGFNRVSIGVQSLVAPVLERLGRTHSASVALAAIAAARRAGVPDVSADLIYGSPWETDDDWRRSLEGIVEAAPDHVSAYALTVEEATPLATLVRTGRTPDVDPDVQAERHATADELLALHGFERYEVSNWARPGRASRHNVLYWSAGDYAGFGAGAHAHAGGRRYWNTRLPRDFIDRTAAGRARRPDVERSSIDAASAVEDGYEVVSSDARAGEAMMLGLRLTTGVEEAGFRDRFGDAYLDAVEPTLADLEAQGLIVRSDGWIRIAPSAVMVANEFISRLI